MFLRTSSRIRYTVGFYGQNVNARFLAAQAESAKFDLPTDDYSRATPLTKIPGPSTISFILSYLPGGQFYNKGFSEVIAACGQQYGNIFRFPPLFGQPSVVFSFNPEHYKVIYRTEGQWPERPTFDTMQYYRENIRPDIFGKHQGLIMAQGKSWADFRTTVNPVMMQPKTTKLYIPAIDEVAGEFLERIRQIRDPETGQLPENFEDELNKWSLESIGVIGLDTRLGLLSATPDKRAAAFIKSVKDFFELSFDLEFKPSLWKLIKTPKFKRLMKILDDITEISSQYVDEARNRAKSTSNCQEADYEESILIKLVKIDPIIAKVMAMDMVFAGVDTTSSAFTGLLYLLARNPNKQEILRQEILTILPEKNTRMTVDRMARLPYLRACIKESQRLLPTVSGNGRMAGRNIVLDGYQIPKGTVLIIHPPVIQRANKYYVNADEFQPERWIRSEVGGKVCPASAKSASPFLYLPFGFGPRMCIGRRLAELEMEVLASKIVRNFYVSWEQPELKFRSTTLNVPAGKLMFTLKDVEK